MKTAEFAAACVYRLLHISDQWGLISAVLSTVHFAVISIGLAPRLGDL